MNIPVTKIVPEHTHFQSITQIFNVSKTMVKKKVTSIDSKRSPLHVNLGIQNNLLDKKKSSITPTRLDKMFAPNDTMHTIATGRINLKVNLHKISGFGPTFYLSNEIVSIANNMIDNSISDSQIHKVDSIPTERMNNINGSKDRIRAAII